MEKKAAQYTLKSTCEVAFQPNKMLPTAIVLQTTGMVQEKKQQRMHHKSDLCLGLILAFYVYCSSDVKNSCVSRFLIASEEIFLYRFLTSCWWYPVPAATIFMY